LKGVKDNLQKHWRLPIADWRRNGGAIRYLGLVATEKELLNRQSAIGNWQMSGWGFAIFPGIAYYFLLPQNQFERLS